MPRSPLATSIGFGAVLQVFVVGAGRLIPAVGLSGNLYPVAAAGIAALAGMRFTRRSPRGPIGATLRGGGLVGAGSSLLGALAAVLVVVIPGPPVQTVGVAMITGAVAGLVGAAVGRALPARAPAATPLIVAPRPDKIFRG